MPAVTQPKTVSRQPIRPGEFLRQEDFLRDTDQGLAAWRTARRHAAKLGIVLQYKSGRQQFVRTDGWLELLERLHELKAS